MTSHRAKVLISRHRDGEVNARAAENLGIGTIRGSGAHNGEFHRKGGAAAFTEMLDALNTATMSRSPPTFRRWRASPASVSSSWRSIPAGRSTRWRSRAAAASSSTIGTAPRSIFRSAGSRWWRAEAIYVARDADAAALEAARQQLESELNRVTARAYDIADRKGSHATVSERLLPRCAPTGCCRRRTPLTPLLLARRLKHGKEHRVRGSPSGAAKPASRGRRARWSGCMAPASANWRACCR